VSSSSATKETATEEFGDSIGIEGSSNIDSSAMDAALEAGDGALELLDFFLRSCVGIGCGSP